MDFFLLEENIDDNLPSQLSGTQAIVSIKQSQDTYLLKCGVCGGHDFYEDFASNRKVCSTCFTQSQEQDEEFVDMEEAMNMAFRDSRGFFRTVKLNGAGSNRVRPSLEEEFGNTPELPSLKVCLQGMRSVLKNGMSCLAQILNMRSETERSALKTVRELWLTYLHSWMEGAEFYGALQTTTRYCFRDYFLVRRSIQVRKYVTYKFLQKLKESTMIGSGNKGDLVLLESDNNLSGSCKEKGKAGSKKRKVSETNREDCYDDSSNDDIYSSDRINTRKRFQSVATAALIRLGCNIAEHRGRHADDFGHKEAALRLKPSMVMVATILWMAVNRSGVSCQQISQWIRSGQLPLTNAYRQLLKDEQQQAALELCMLFFKIEFPPSPTAIENIAKVLMVACRLKTSCKELIFNTKVRDVQSSIRTWPKDCLPIVIAHTISEAGLSQFVLDRALALLGVLNRTLTPLDKLIPPLPAALASPDDVTCMEDVLAVILIACKLDRNWRNMKFVFRYGKESSRVPLNEAEFRNLTNTGSSLESYLAYIEKCILLKPSQAHEVHAANKGVRTKAKTESLLPTEYWRVGNEILPNLISKFCVNENRCDDDSEKSFGNCDLHLDDNCSQNVAKGEKVVRPCSIIAGALLPSSESCFNIHRDYRKNGIFDTRGRHLEEYQKSAKNVNYSNLEDFERMDRSNRDWIPHGSPDPKHDLLVQYLAYTAQVDPYILYRSVEKLLSCSLKQQSEFKV